LEFPIEPYIFCPIFLLLRLSAALIKDFIIFDRVEFFLCNLNFCHICYVSVCSNFIRF
jgi:hypothetical protein